jgi:hypothetical protein
MPTKTKVCCWYDPSTGLTTCGSCFQQAPLAIGGVQVADGGLVITQAKGAAKAPAVEPDTTGDTAATVGNAVSSLAGIAGTLAGAMPYVAAAQAAIGLVIAALPAIQKLMRGEPVSVEEQANLDAFMQTIEDGTAFSGPEWKQD